MIKFSWKSYVNWITYFQFRHLCKRFLLCRRRLFAGKFAEKTNFERVWNDDFLFDDAVVKDLNISDNDLSNDIIDIVLNLNDWCDWMMNFFWFVNRTNDLMFLFISRLLYNEIVTLFHLILFITNYLYNKLI